MSEFERRIKELAARLSQWFNSGAKSARQRRADGTEGLRRGATARAQRAASKLGDLRESDRAQRAASALHDLRESEAAKRAEAALHDLRVSDAGKKAESALADLRQREPVKKATDGARKVLNDLFSGGSGSSSTTGDQDH
jgi:hypothetical protein